VYIASGLVGEAGCVIGIDMTQGQIGIAIKYREEQARRFGFKEPNTKFLQGYIEDLQSLDIAGNSIDVVISNCVINLSPEKSQVSKEIYRMLKPGGELFFSDVFADRRIPEALALNPVLRGECLSGALYVEDFRRMMAGCGWNDFRYTSIRDLEPDNREIEEKIGFATFSSRTVRAFKLDDLEDTCEDYGQVAYYDGGIPGHPHFFDLDNHHRFFTGKPMLVCGNSAPMVSGTRYGRAFRVIGDRKTHYGLFAACGTGANTVDAAGETGVCCC